MHMEQTTSSTSSATFTGTSPKTAGPASPASPKQQFLDVFSRESATTRRVLKALPDSATELRPHPTSQCAREVASIFSIGQGLAAAALTNNWQWPPQFPAAPATYAEVLANFEATNQAVLQALENTPDSRLLEMVPFFTGPNQIGEVRVIDLMWFMLLDGIHHRGQLSVYLRMAGAKVPSIYGPSKDEPWM
jgi:uncharacterized damage-inducible protein DinB